MKNCIKCYSEIDDNASYCKFCNMHQSPWKNWLPNATNYIAVLVLLGSMILWGTEKSTHFFTNITWKDNVEILLFANTSGLVVKNTGDGAVFIERIDIDSIGHKFGFIESVTIGKTLKKNEFGSFDLENKVNGDIYFEEEKSDIDAREKKLEALVRGSGKNPRIKKVIFNKEHARWLQANEILGKQILSIDAKAKLVYHSLRKNNVIIKDFDCILVFLKEKS